MATLHQNPQATNANQEQDLDELQVPEPHRQNPLWKIVKSTAKRAHESWETTLADGMQKHQDAINGVVKGAQTLVNQSIHTATNAYDSVAKGVTTEARAGITIVRQSLGLKAASDELERELKLSESALGGSPALPHDQREALNKLARDEQATIRAEGDRRLGTTLSKNEHLSHDRHTIHTELQAIGEEGVNAVTKLRMDFRAAKAQIEQLNRTGQPVDVAKVFDAVRKTESKPERNRSKIVSLLIGQSSPEKTSTESTSEIPAQPKEPSETTIETKPELHVVTPKPQPEQGTTEIHDVLQSLSKTRLRRIATALNAEVDEANKITKVRSRDKDELLELLNSPERLEILGQKRSLIDDNLTATAALALKGDRITTQSQ